MIESEYILSYSLEDTMALGLCCQWLGHDSKGRVKNLLPSKTLQLGRFQDNKYTEERIKETYLQNLTCLLSILPAVVNSGIRSMRVSSSMFPLFDRVDRALWDNEAVHALLQEIGQYVMTHEVRFTTHPDQFCVLSSDSQSVVDNSVSIINHHAWVFDQMGLSETPFYAINVHGGKSDRAAQLCKGIDQLQGSARNRLTLENCEFAYSVQELYAVHKDSDIPIVFDSHHHKFRTDSLSGEEALWLALETWPEGVKALTHLSNTKEDCVSCENPRDLRKHSDYIYEIPEYQREAHEAQLIDIDIEAKKKNFAIFKMVENFDISLN